MSASSIWTAGVRRKCIITAQSATYASIRGLSIINLTNILMHRLDGVSWHTHTTAHATWVQAAGGTVRTSPIGPWQHGYEGGAERGDWRVYSPA